MESYRRMRKPRTIRKTGVIEEYHTLGKKGGVRVISLHGLADGSVEVRPGGRSNMILDQELLKLLCAPGTMPAIKRHMRDQKKMIKTLLSRRNRGTPILLRKSRFMSEAPDAEVPPPESGELARLDLTHHDPAPDFTDEDSD